MQIERPSIPGTLWMLDGKCATDQEYQERLRTSHYDPLLDNQAAAKDYCNDCPVLAECRMYGLSHRELQGVWGGLTERSRSRYRTRLDKQLANFVAQMQGQPQDEPDPSEDEADAEE